MPRKIMGLVLAAGRSKRSPFPKALGVLDGETLVARSIRTLAEAGVDPVIVVVASPHGEEIRRALPGVECVTNPEPERGMLSSLAVGMRALLARGPTHVVFALVDHPHVRPTTIRKLLDSIGDGGSARPRMGARTGHPVVVDTRVAEALASAALALTARDVLSRFPIVDVEVDDPAVLEDLDTGAELARAEVKAQ